MEDLKIIRKLPNSTEYLTKLITAANAGDEGTIGEVFEKLEQELKKIREESSITFERSKNKWNDPETHFRQVQVEETRDLQNEFEDRMDLFKLASMCNYEPIMAFEFAKMIQNLADIRERRSIRFERNKIMWNDPEAHFRKAQVEENMDAQKEISDLFRLYKVAKSANYTAGMELISSKLGGITPNMIDSLSEIGKKHK